MAFWACMSSVGGRRLLSAAEKAWMVEGVAEMRQEAAGGTHQGQQYRAQPQVAWTVTKSSVQSFLYQGHAGTDEGQDLRHKVQGCQANQAEIISGSHGTMATGP